MNNDNKKREVDNTDKKLHISDVIPSFNKRYFFDGIFWYKKDEGKKLEIMTNDEIEVMKKNTVEGQWLLDDKFENRTDIRTWVTEEKTELQKLTNQSLLIADVIPMLHKIAYLIDNAVENGEDEKVSEIVELMKAIVDDNWIFVRK
jgi:hypothetical protein